MQTIQQAIKKNRAYYCLDCGKCEEACTQGLPIRQRLLKVKAAWQEVEAQVAAEQKS